MALAVDNTPLSPTCNSFASVAEMGAYLSERVPDPAALTSWDALTDALKAQYLVNASRTIDSLCDWIGDRYSSDQLLSWPRCGAWVDGRLIDDINVFPTEVIEATCEMALWLLQNNGLISVQQNLAYDSIKVGPLSIDFNESAGGPKDKYFPDSVAIILDGFGVMRNPLLPGTNQIRAMRLYRA